MCVFLHVYIWKEREVLRNCHILVHTIVETSKSDEGQLASWKLQKEKAIAEV